MNSSFLFKVFNDVMTETEDSEVVFELVSPSSPQPSTSRVDIENIEPLPNILRGGPSNSMSRTPRGKKRMAEDVELGDLITTATKAIGQLNNEGKNAEPQSAVDIFCR